MDQRVSRPRSQESPGTTTEQQDPVIKHVSQAEYVVSRLYPDRELGILLKYWFDELEIFYPCVDRVDFYERLSSFFIEHCTCENGMTRIPKEPRHIYLAALTCGMASLATYLGAGTKPNHRFQEDDYYLKTSMSWYSESRKLLGCIPQSAQEPNIDLLRLQIVEVLHMTIHEDKGGMSKAMVLAIDLAFALRLNDESAWNSFPPKAKEFHRLVWWTVYHFDRRVALKVCRPILIHDADFVVGGFTVESRDIYINDHFSTSQMDQETEPRTLLLQWAPPSARTQDWFDYLLFFSKWDELVTQIWDTCFSLRALKQPDIAKLAISDQLLTKLHSNLPPGLMWDPKQLPNQMQLGDVDRSFRLRLLVFETINMLRLFILSIHPSTTNTQVVLGSRGVQQTAQAAEKIAANTMNSLVSYLNVRKHARPWVTYASLLLVEATSRIAPLVKSQEDSPTDATHRVVASIVSAKSCLGAMNLGVSCRAAKRLAAVLDDVSGIFTARIPRTIELDSEKADLGNGEHLWRNGHTERHNSFEGTTPNFDVDEFWLGNLWYDLSSTSIFDYP